jgi:hypothetical protein
LLTWILRAATEDKLLTAVCMLVVLPGCLLLLLQHLPRPQAFDPTVRDYIKGLYKPCRALQQCPHHLHEICCVSAAAEAVNAPQDRFGSLQQFWTEQESLCDALECNRTKGAYDNLARHLSISSLPDQSETFNTSS